MGDISDVKTHNEIPIIEKIIKPKIGLRLLPLGGEAEGHSIKWHAHVIQVELCEVVVCK
jgi:hypothetical protein